jgi:hypothetical protein
MEYDGQQTPYLELVRSYVGIILLSCASSSMWRLRSVPITQAIVSCRRRRKLSGLSSDKKLLPSLTSKRNPSSQ